MKILKQIVIPELRQIPEYPDYYVSIDGRVFSDRKFGLVELKFILSKQGYNTVCLYSPEGKQRNTKVHRLVYQMYSNNGNPLDKLLVVNHLDGNKVNNHISNLELVTQKRNVNHSYDNGQSTNHSEQHYGAKLTDLQVQQIRDEYTGGWGEQIKLAEKYGVTQGNISAIVLGNLRKRNPDGSLKKLEVKRGRPSEQERLEMISLVKGGKSLGEVGRMYGVTRQAVWWLVNKKQ